MYKNPSGQKLAVFAYATSAGAPYPPKTGLTVTAQISKAGNASAAVAAQRDCSDFLLVVCYLCS